MSGYTVRQIKIDDKVSEQVSMLVTHDCGLFGGGLWEGLRNKKAHVLCALPANVLMKRFYTLHDGSYVASTNPRSVVCPHQLLSVHTSAFSILCNSSLRKGEMTGVSQEMNPYFKCIVPCGCPAHALPCRSTF